MKRTDLLNHLAIKYDLQNYLEIGVQVKSQNFDKIVCQLKVCVDPDPMAKATFQMTSDEFFDAQIPLTPKFDLIFIDGLHEAQQVEKDFHNALKILSKTGFIVLHDCNPELEVHTIVPRPKARGHWNGDVYKFAVRILHAMTVNIDNGCLVYRNSPNTVILNHDVTWEYFDKNRRTLLNLTSWHDFVTRSHIQSV